MKKSFVTIKDIAKELGVSASTVSRALKDHPDISQRTKDNVVQKAKELGYQPNAIALSLKNRKTKIIGVVIPEIVHHFFSLVISGIEEVAQEEGYNVLISQSNESYQREVHNIKALLGSRVDGILISRTKETTNFEHFFEIERSGIPMVFFDRPCTGITVDNVVIDDKSAAFSAVEHLIKTGCVRIVHLEGPLVLSISKNRLAGYQDALKKYNLPVDETLIFEADNFEKGFKIVEELISNNVSFDAIFATNDLTALGAMSALKKHKMKIPDQVSVFGFTNGLVSRFSEPPLSTIEQNGYLMGYEAAKMLIKHINSEDEIEVIRKIIPTEIIVRETTRK